MNLSFNYELLGLDPRDMRIYRTLYEHAEPASVRKAAEWTGLNRGVVFDSMRKLAEAGLLSSHLHGKQKRYAANDPSVLATIAHFKREELQNEQHKIDEYVKSIRLLGTTAVPTQFAAMYEGEEEIAILLRDVLVTTQKLALKQYCIISAADLRGHLYKRFKNFTRQRIQLGISVKSLGIGSIGTPAELSERRLLAGADSLAPACYVIVYSEKVALISLHEDLTPYGIVIHNKELAALQQLVFDQLWTLAQP